MVAVLDQTHEAGLEVGIGDAMLCADVAQALVQCGAGEAVAACQLADEVAENDAFGAAFVRFEGEAVGVSGFLGRLEQPGCEAAFAEACGPCEHKGAGFA